MDHEVSKTARARDERARPIAVCGDDVITYLHRASAVPLMLVLGSSLYSVESKGKLYRWRYTSGAQARKGLVG